MSFILLVNLQDEIIGNTPRDILLPSDIYRVSALWVENSKGEVLIAQRAYTKKKWPWLWWPAVAGTIEVGETYEENIYKEAVEEIGLSKTNFTVEPKELTHGQNRYFLQWFSTVVDYDLDFFKLQKDEVEAIQRIHKTSLLDDIKKSPEKYTFSLTKNPFIASRLK